jgi:tetratricopeptide (TPR) repeat protein
MSSTLDQPTLQELLALVDERLKDFAPGQTFTNASVLEIINRFVEKNKKETAADLGYLEKKDLIKPQTIVKGKERKVRSYSLSDLRNALYVAYGKKYNYTLRQAVVVLNSLGTDSTSLMNLTRATTPKIEMDGFEQVKRVQMHLRGRVLQVILQQLCGVILRDGILIVEYTGSYDRLVEQSSQLIISPKPEAEVKNLLLHIDKDKVNNQTVIGWCTGEGEIMTHLNDSDINRLLKKMVYWNFYIISSFSEDQNCNYHITLGLSKSPNSSEMIELKNRLDHAQIGLISFEIKFLHMLLAVLFNSIQRLHSLMDYRGQRNWDSSQGDILAVLLNAVVALQQSKWYYAALLMPTSQDPPRLYVASKSDRFPDELRNQVSYDEGQSIAGWSWKAGQPIAINVVIEKDPRLILQEQEQPTAIAALPTYGNKKSLKDRPNGILYIGSRADIKEIKEPIFSDIDLKVLTLFAQTAGEMIERINIVRSNVEGVLAESLIPPTKMGSKQDFDIKLRELLNKIGNGAINLKNISDSLVIIVISITGTEYDNLKKHDLIVADWLSSQITEKLFRFLYTNLRQLSNVERTIYKFNPSQFAVLISSIASDQDIRKEFRKELASWGSMGISLEGLDEDEQLRIISWSLPFRIDDLTRRYQLTSTRDKGVDDAAAILSDKTTRALDILEFIERGDTLLEQGQFDDALVAYREAKAVDENNSYILRHIAQCYIEIGEYEEAINYINRAIKTDLQEKQDGDNDIINSKTHRCLARAYAGAGRYKEAFDCLDGLINTNKTDPETYLQYGMLLVQTGDPDYIAQAPTKYHAALKYDQRDDLTRARYYRYIGEAYLLIYNYKEAASSFRIAVAKDPKNEDLRWLFQRALAMQRPK